MMEDDIYRRERTGCLAPFVILAATLALAIYGITRMFT